MRRSILNLAALRASCPEPAGDTLRPHDTESRDIVGAHGTNRRDTVSRRQALGLAGVAAATLSPALHAAETLALGRYTMARTGQTRLAFLVNGHERWVIDTSRFAGSPHLTVRQEAKSLRVELRGARYPGTDLPADFRCVIRRGATQSRLTLRLTLGGFSGSVPFESWLAGLAPLRSTVHLHNLRCPLSASATLLLDGAAEATYAPDWTTELHGHAIGTLRGLGAPLTADTAQLSLPARDAPSLLSAPGPKRTAIALWRGGQTWRLQPAFQPNGRWRLAPAKGSNGAFDLIRLELGEDGRGARRPALLAEMGEALAFQPHRGLASAAGTTFALNLSGARYAVAFDPAGDHAALVARFHPRSVWLTVGGCAVELGDALDAPPFELHAHDGTVTELRCNPAVLRVAAPIAGAVVQPTLQAPGTRLAIVASGLERPHNARAAQLILSDHPANPAPRFTLVSPRFDVLRTDDLLALTFEFIYMKLNASAKGKPPVLIPLNKKRPSYLAVHVQGQNIAEQAFFRVQPETPIPSTPPGPDQPPDPDANPIPAPGGTDEFPEGQPFFPVNKRLAGESRLVFAMPPGFTSLPLVLDTLLDWSPFTPSVPPTALPAGEITKAPIAEPANTETALEIPWRLQIAPNRFSGWVHAFSPVTRNGWTELWHTRLGVKVVTKATKKMPGHTYLVDVHYLYEGQDTPLGRAYTVTGDVYLGNRPVDVLHGYRTIRAVWSQDFPQASRLPDNVPFRTSLTGQDRFDLVALTSFFQRARPGGPGPGGAVLLSVVEGSYNPLPVQVNRLMLTTLGAWVDVHGAWSQGYHIGVGLEEWTHRGTQGRDHYVRVVYKGYLFPFGHKASLIKITERKFYEQGGRNIAYLFQRMFIIVREPLKQFGNSGLSDSAGRSIDRAMPFKSIQITTTTTPDIEPPVEIPGVGSHATDAFWPQVGGTDFLFHCIGQDQDGQRTEFTAPLAFVGVENFVAYDATQMATLENLYQGSSDDYPTRHTRLTNGAKVAFAPSNSPGDTTLHAADITFDAFVPPDSTPLPDDQPRFYPTVKASTVGIPAVEALLRTGQRPQIKLSDHYLIDGLGGANAGEVFAEILDTTRPAVTFGGSNSGGTGTPGVATPNLSISALSRVFGPVGGDMIDQVAAGNVPDVGAFLQQFFDNDAKILGAVPLSSIIKLPSLTPIFQVLSLVQSIQSAPDTLNGLVSQGAAGLQGNLASLSAQARAALQSQLAPLRAALAALQAPLTALHNALTALPSIVTDLLGDLSTIIMDLGTLLSDLSTLISSLDKLLTDLGAASLGALNGDASALQSPLTAFPNDLKKLVDDLGNLQGITPLPLLKNTPLPTAIDTTLTWTPHLQSSPPFTALDKFLSVTATVHIPLDGSEPSFSIVGTLGKIGIDLASIIHVGFGGLTFSVSSGEKPDVKAGAVDVLFEGPLAFVNDLKDAIPSNGFTDPPFVDITPDGVEAGFNFDLPSLGVGIFSLENISLGAKVTIPFIGSSPAQIYFNFCTREHPFILTVSLLGGGGFFGISLGLDGLDMMEASFEFGAELSLDFGIASGSVSVMAGIYFKMEKSPQDQTVLTGFVHIHGDVEALEILSVSIDLELDLTYEKDGHDTKVVGDATLTVSVHVLFFSATVSASVHREFAGSHHDPSFIDQVSEHDWNDYLLAFA